MRLAIPDTICELLDTRASTTPSESACVSHAADGQCETFSWDEFRTRIVQIAGGLKDFVEQPGTVAAIRLPTSLTYELVSHALLRLGCVIVGVDSHASPADVTEILKRCRARLLVTDAALLADIVEAVLPSITAFIVIGELPGHTASVEGKVHALSQILNVGKCVDPKQHPTLPSPKHLATIIFTSGTTGEPKGIPFRHEQIMAACRAVSNAYDELRPQDSTICWLPLSALFQRMANMLSMANGMTTHFIADPRQIMQHIAKLRPSFLVGVPRFFEKLNDALHDNSLNELQSAAGNVKYMVSGSAPLPTTLLDSLLARGILVLEAYGLSENTVPIALNRASNYRFGSVGQALAPNHVRLATDGEVEVQGVGVFSGYFSATAVDCFTEDGFYRTGDLGEFDADGFLHLIGRKRDLFKTSTGRRIGPSRIEATYAACPSVDQLVVIGDNQKYLAALVTLKAPSQFRPAFGTGRSLLDLFVEFRATDANLSEHERVQAIGILKRPFQGDEVTSSLKLKRDVIVRKYSSFISRLYSTPTPCVLEVLPEET